MIKVEGLTKAYHHHKVVDEVDIEIEKGKSHHSLVQTGQVKVRS